MIDSVIFRLHGLEANKHVISVMYGKQNSMSVLSFDETQRDIDRMAHIRKYIKFWDTGRYLMQTPFENYHFTNLTGMPSSHYSVACQINYHHDYIEFNVSIPKFLYGHNILQFVPDHLTRNFQMYRNSLFINNVDDVYRMFYLFMDTFFSSHFGVSPDYRAIEIVAIDLCYNQYFNSRTDALDYMKMIKEIRKSYVRDTSNFFNNWTTTIAYKSDGRFMKIYHKGEEYKYNDRKQHEKINKQKKTMVFDVGFLQDHSDKILRYEVRYFFGFMSYKFRHFIFRKDCMEHKKAQKMFNRCNNYERRGKLLELPKYERQFWKYYKNMLGLTDKVYMLNDFEHLQQYLTVTPPGVIQYDFINRGEPIFVGEKQHYNRIKFSLPLFQLLAKDLMGFFNEFQVNGLPTITNYSKLIDKYIQDVRDENYLNKHLINWGGKKPKKLPNKNRLLNLIAILNQYSFQEIESMALYPESTWFRYKSDLKKMGITKTSMVKGESIVHCDDYSVYYQALVNSYRRFLPYDNDYSYRQMLNV